MLQEIVASRNSVVVYESKHRILKLLDELAEHESVSGQSWSLIVARELTKIHESLYSGTINEVRQELISQPTNLKGEFVVLIKK